MNFGVVVRLENFDQEVNGSKPLSTQFIFLLIKEDDVSAPHQQLTSQRSTIDC